MSAGARERMSVRASACGSKKGKRGGSEQVKERASEQVAYLLLADDSRHSRRGHDAIPALEVGAAGGGSRDRGRGRIKRWEKRSIRRVQEQARTAPFQYPRLQTGAVMVGADGAFLCMWIAVEVSVWAPMWILQCQYHTYYS